MSTAGRSARGAVEAATAVFGSDQYNDTAAVEGARFALGIAQVEATLYVGEQLERIAAVMGQGFVTAEGNYPGVWITRPREDS